MLLWMLVCLVHCCVVVRWVVGTALSGGLLLLWGPVVVAAGACIGRLMSYGQLQMTRHSRLVESIVCASKRTCQLSSSVDTTWMSTTQLLQHSLLYKQLAQSVVILVAA
jgi:hypothetical protein